MPNRDVVIVGAGHNALVAAYYLARAGIAVEVVEAQDAVGGACKTEQLVPGYSFSTCANYLVWLRARVAEDMRLFDDDGVADALEVGRAGPATRILEGNRPFVWWEDEDELLAQIGDFSRADMRAWPEWKALWLRTAELLGPFMLGYPPMLPQLFQRAAALKAENLLSGVLTTSLAQLVDRYFESPEMRSSVTSPHDMGSLWDHGSGLAMAMAASMSAYSETGLRVPQGYVRGGMGRVTEAMKSRAEREGAVLRCGSAVDQIKVDDGRVVGVRLANGDEIAASVVVSGVDPKRTFLQLISGSALPPSLRTRVEQLRTDIAPLKFHCALSELPEYFAFEGSDLPALGPLTINPSREHYERAWDDARHARLPRAPFMVAMTPSTWDASVAPTGHHTVSFWILFAPVRLRDGSWPDRRDEMSERLLTQLDRYSPNFRRALVDCKLLTPWDLEQQVLLTDGNIHHVDLVPSQMLWQRPCRELARYRASIKGLYLCGAGQHPYGEVSGGPGHNAAHAILEDFGVISPTSWQQEYRAGDGAMVHPSNLVIP